MSDLAGRRILVTGGGSGIGRAISRAAAHAGAEVAVLDRDATAARVTVNEIRAAGASAVGIGCDITDEHAVRAAVRDLDDTRPLDGAVLNAGIQLHGSDGPIDTLDLDVLRRTLEVNVIGTAITAKHVGATMRARGRGSIVFIGSPTGLVGQPPDTAYGTSKAAVHGLARVMAAELAPSGVRVNVVVPGYTETPLTSAITGDPSAVTDLLSRIPLGRPGLPEDAAAMVVFLLSEATTYATGGTFVVDGGMTAV